MIENFEIKLQRLNALNTMWKEFDGYFDVPDEYKDEFKGKFDLFMQNLINEEMMKEQVKPPYMSITAEDLKVLEIVGDKYGIE